VGQTNGAVPSGFLTADVTYLQPQSQCGVLQEQLGNSRSPYVVTLILEQAPFCYSQFSTPLPAASVSVSTVQAGSGTANQILGVTTNGYAGNYTVSLTAQATISIASNTAASPTVVSTNGNHNFATGQTVNIPANNGSNATILGSHVVTVVSATTFSIPIDCTTAGGIGGTVLTASITATCGQATPGMNASQIGLLLANHPLVFYANQANNPNNVIINVLGNQSYQVTFTGTLGNNTAPAFTFPANTLVAPEGFSGTLNYNTVSLYNYSRGQNGNSFAVPFSISRIRSSGEKRTLLLIYNYTIYKDNLNYLTAVPVSLPGAVIYNPATGALISPTAAQFFTVNTLPQFLAWILTLPITLPAGPPGQPWLNGGNLAFS
jgi:hypothetical protein